MFKTRVLAQRILLSIFFVISNVENHEKIAFMKIKKKCRAGAKCRARWDQNHLIFFTWPKWIKTPRSLVDLKSML